jgi:hypothetical protein
MMVSMTTEGSSQMRELTPQEMTCAAINRFGTGEHPYADEKSLPGFALEYALSCLGHASNDGWHSIDPAAEWCSANLKSRDAIMRLERLTAPKGAS